MNVATACNNTNGVSTLDVNLAPKKRCKAQRSARLKDELEFSEGHFHAFDRRAIGHGGRTGKPRAVDLPRELSWCRRLECITDSAAWGTRQRGVCSCGEGEGVVVIPLGLHRVQLCRGRKELGGERAASHHATTPCGYYECSKLLTLVHLLEHFRSECALTVYHRPIVEWMQEGCTRLLRELLCKRRCGNFSIFSGSRRAQHHFGAILLRPGELQRRCIVRCDDGARDTFAGGCQRECLCKITRTKCNDTLFPFFFCELHNSVQAASKLECTSVLEALGLDFDPQILHTESLTNKGIK